MLAVRASLLGGSDQSREATTYTGIVGGCCCVGGYIVSAVSDMVSEVAKDDGATILEDVNSKNMNILFWFPLPIFFYKTVTMTANGVK